MSTPESNASDRPSSIPDREDRASRLQPRDFIRSMVAADLESGKHDGRVVTRFPPEPNGYPHIGHAKSICLNFGLASEVPGAVCHLRFDDTNPTTEDPEYVEAIQEDIRWLGFDWGEHLYFASDYFETLYGHAQQLIRDGKAYVDSLSEEEIREYRGTVTEAGRPSPHRERSVEENLDLFARMRAGEFAEGAHVLRAKIDMAAANMKMRDPLLYRIRKAHHYRTGDAWPIYPMYDFAHPLSDAIEGITHSLCTLEFENNRDVYDWLIEHVDVPYHPEQTEFARLNLDHTVMSKRKLLELVEGGHVSGWDDPRMPTLRGYRRRGYTPESIRAFCETIGVAKSNSVVDVAQLEHAIRDDLNSKVPRVLCVLRPLKVVIENYPEGQVEELEAPYYPHDIPLEGSRKLPFSQEIYIEREDFREDPPKKYFRLAPDREVRLRYGYFIRCREVIKDEAGQVVELRCTYDPETRGGSAPDGRKVKGTIHWVSAEESLSCQVRLYDRLFLDPKPDRGKGGEDFKTFLNPNSLEILDEARIERSVGEDEPGSRYQFERQGYFYFDPATSTEEQPVFIRTVTLRDSWAKSRQAPAAEPQPKKEARAGGGDPGAAPSQPRKEKAPAPLNAEQEAVSQRYRDELGLPEPEARLIAGDEALQAFFEAGVEDPSRARGVANWVVHELLREIKERPLADLPFGGAQLAELVGLIEDETISGAIAKKVFARLLESGGDPRAIVEDEGLAQITDEGVLRAVVEEVLAANEESVARYREGKKALFGFFVGQVMKATRGKADPQRANALLRAALDG